MWQEIKKANSLMFAEMWKELFEGEGVPARIWPACHSTECTAGRTSSGMPIGQELVAYSVQVPKDKVHVIEDVLRKL